MQESGTGMPLLGWDSTVSGLPGGLEGQGETEGTPRSGSTRYTNRTGMGFHDALGDGQAETGAMALAVGSLAANLGKLVENAALVLRGNADARVLHGYLDCTALLAGRDGNGSAGFSELQRIAEQVDEHLLDALGIHDQPRQPAG